MYSKKYIDFITQMEKKDQATRSKPNKLPAELPPHSNLTANALMQVSGGAQCNDCVYLSFSKSLNF
ncbi:hypothetical protein CC99x_003480 [Candidatus Berkiella cookevillensis]|uniref:Uncharacterized protein n=1 Tax=Candidatus Berkiella cookevillensis TaxID=437022 RepID=A0A0Q9YLJ8_9GAMM|nr:hypothetical protein [Candidatus Berkiella cookevillensis]MCS5707959.1 hypothetical protein [Candidatus Berkiella cookevillensis]